MRLFIFVKLGSQFCKTNAVSVHLKILHIQTVNTLTIPIHTHTRLGRRRCVVQTKPFDEVCTVRALSAVRYWC